MAITFQLAEGSPEMLRYLATHDGAAGDAATIPNDGGVTPDLLTDIQAVMAEYGRDASAGSPLAALIRARTDGYGPIAAGALTQAQARALFNGEDPARAVLAHPELGFAVLEVEPRSGATSWSADANVDGQGDPVVAVTAEAGAATCYVTLRFIHSEKV